MIGRQVYHRNDLHVDFPQLDKVSTTQPITEFKTARKYYGNIKNEGSPEFRVGSFAYQVQEANYRSKASLESEKTISTRPSQNASVPSEDPRIKEAELTDPIEIEILKEELRRKDEEIRRLLQYDRSRTPILPPARPDPARSLTPIELYQLGAGPHTPTYSISHTSKPKSVSPFRGDARNPSVFAVNGGFVAQKEQPESMGVHELARMPAFQQPKYTAKHPKVHTDNPITGEG